MTISYETGARKLERAEIDVINYSDVHPHDPKKVVAFAPDRPQTAPHPSMVSRHRRMARKAALQQKLLVTYPRYICVAFLALFVYLRLATFAEMPSTGLNFLWISAYALAGISCVFSRTLNHPGAQQ